MEWRDLGAALALVLVIEGLLPFANPAGMRRTLAAIAQLPEDRLRRIGLVSIIAGLVLLFLIRS